jgi:hypothetical protein
MIAHGKNPRSQDMSEPPDCWRLLDGSPESVSGQTNREGGFANNLGPDAGNQRSRRCADNLEGGFHGGPPARVSAGAGPRLRRSGTTRYLVTLLAGKEDDAEAFATSFAATFAPPLDEHGRVAWANTIAHEIFHFWCGHMVHGVGTELEWLQEGFTEYYANIGLVRAGAFSPADFLDHVEHNLGHYVYFMTSPLSATCRSYAPGRRRARTASASTAAAGRSRSAWTMPSASLPATSVRSTT